ncbi:KUP/HAK/KT family potassium transporter [Rhizomicrobium electricum]|uniref:Probable potassium transport system protein Kup n=1 Tax=Rhizomicrobium electricum TaxID=480070 RepID=A0ABP3Q6W1_9PROT|nr:KUP system potassium uptake protein [Rhizomicrobium electricum]
MTDTDHPSPQESDDPLEAASSLGGHHAPAQVGFKRKAFLTLAALGIVFGDIGTSPLYALHQSALAAQQNTALNHAIYGVVSLIFWSLILVVTLKYVTLIMRADNDGEGGELALASLAHRVQGLDRRVKLLIGTGAILGLSLFFGDGMLTPAITVLSAVEGLAATSRHFEPLVVPFSLVILIGLFAFQSRGTAQVGRLFGPVMVVWFLVLAALGTGSIVKTPEILWALSPHYGLMLFVDEPWTAFVTLGSVVLAVTGCETLYADMGHFGKGPIRAAWLFFVLPALFLNYFGQGAALLREPNALTNPFYSMAPDWAHYPLVILATIAASIASQAVISGVFSIARQAIQLGMLPRMEIRHTSATDYGQIFVPRMNAVLCVGVVLIVLIFKNSNALGAAYGIAVTGEMFISTMLVGLVAVRQWKWSIWTAVPLFGLLGFVDLAFLGSNALKIVEGGWLPLFIATCVYAIMGTWRLGRRVQLDRIRNESMPLNLLVERAEKTPVRVAGTAVFLSARADVCPSALLHNLKHNKVLHERILITQVMVDDTPLVAPEKRLEVEKLGKGFYSVHIHHGFFETPDVPKALSEARKFGLAIDPETTTFFIGRETLVPAEHSQMESWRRWIYMQLAANALSPARFYRLPPNRVIELGAQVTI